MKCMYLLNIVSHVSHIIYITYITYKMHSIWIEPSLYINTIICLVLHFCQCIYYFFFLVFPYSRLSISLTTSSSSKCLLYSFQYNPVLHMCSIHRSWFDYIPNCIVCDQTACSAYAWIHVKRRQEQSRKKKYEKYFLVCAFSLFSFITIIRIASFFTNWMSKCILELVLDNDERNKNEE